MSQPSVVLTSLLTALVAVGGLPLFAVAQQPDDSIRAAALRDYHGPDHKGKDGPLSKAGLDLLMIYHEYRASQMGDGDVPALQEEGDDGFRTSVTDARTTNGHVTIDAIADGATDTLRSSLEDLGLKNVAAAGQVVSGRLPIEKIPAMAKLESLRAVSPSRMQTRSDQSQGAPPSESPSLDTTTIEASEPPVGDSTESRGGPEEADDNMLETGLLAGAAAVIAGLLGFLLWR